MPAREPDVLNAARQPVLVVNGVRKSFGKAGVLRDVDLCIRSGEVVALMGRNGAGKSTLIRILGTTVLPDAGHVSIADVDVVQNPVGARRRSGLVLSDERSWYWRLTGRQNLEFFARLSGLRRAAARTIADQLLEEVELSDVADRRFDQYSSGMRTRLSIARALVLDPPLLLLDEPTRALDPLVANDLRASMRARVDRGCAVLWVTHDPHEAADVADRVVVMSEGRLVQVADRTERDIGAESLVEAMRSLEVSQ
ncbi:ABC transporter ATP-binding protein [Humibacter sp.]|uniref:ABC transporter ATP-binding protein n=1 Tax=Humibacter sp. TaxID=1940291 RepID=UPI002C0A92D2|nr:ABC transporter ATP-binding protein [Humibacter sp.]HVX07926.1 ABC transporter ATP-binding protein [Humibacter sp.]